MLMADVYDQVKSHFRNMEGVTVNEGRGAQGIKVPVKGKEKMVIMFSKGDLLVQFSAERTAELIAKKAGKAYDPGTGKPMKDRVLFPAKDKQHWIRYCEESIAYFRSR